MQCLGAEYLVRATIWALGKRPLRAPVQAGRFRLPRPLGIKSLLCDTAPLRTPGPEDPVHKYRPRSERHKGLEGEGCPYLQLYLAPRGLYTHPAGLPRRKSQVTKLSYFKQPLERFGFG